MQFLFPAMLLGALGVSAPILIHLFNRFRFKQVEWGAMELLRKAVIIRSRKIRIEDLLLLALRCLIIIVLALALARPILTPQGAPWLGKSNDVSVVIALDGSFSMGHKPATKARFDRAADRVREIAKTLKPGNPITLVLCGDRPRFILKNEGFDSERLEARLKTLAPLPERLNVDACLDEISGDKFLEEIKSPVLEFYLISDAQANSWNPLSEKSKQAITQLGQAGKVFFMPVAADNSENLAITRFDLKSGVVTKGVTVEVEVGNFGNRPRDVTISLLVNDQPVDQQVIEKLGPDQKQTIPMFARIDKPGPARLTAKLDADELLLDNVRHAVVSVPDKTKVLLVRSPSGQKEEVDFLDKALAPRDSMSVTKATYLESTGSLSDYKIVILNNVADVDPNLVRNLYYFVKDGGGLIVFLGDNTHPDLTNLRFQVDGESILPAELGKLASDAKGFGIQAVDHPLSRVIRSLPSEAMRLASVTSYFKLKLGPKSQEVLKIAGTGDTLVAEQSQGRGKVILYASNANNPWTSDPPIVPILINEAVSFLSRPAYEHPFTVSDSLLVQLPVVDRVDDSTKDVIQVKKATFHRLGDETKTTRDVERKDGQVYAQLPLAEQPGFWEISTDPPMPPLYAAVNVDARESRVQVLSADGLTAAFQGLPVRLMTEGDAFEASIHDNRIGKELWKEALILLLALLVIEGLLARWITRKKVPVEGANP